MTVCIKDFDRFLFYKTKNKNKTYFCKSCLQCFSSKNVSTEHEEVCLSINDAQSVRLEKRATEFKSYFKQIPVPIKIYAEFGCNLESVESYEGSYSKKYQDHIPCSFAYKLAFRGKEYEYCKKVAKKHFNKNLIMSEEEEQFQSSST